MIVCQVFLDIFLINFFILDKYGCLVYTIYKYIFDKELSYIPSQGDIIMINFDPQTGREQKGRRPALVMPFMWYMFQKILAIDLVCSFAQ